MTKVLSIVEAGRFPLKGKNKENRAFNIPRHQELMMIHPADVLHFNPLGDIIDPEKAAVKREAFVHQNSSFLIDSNEIVMVVESPAGRHTKITQSGFVLEESHKGENKLILVRYWSMRKHSLSIEDY